jgi:hypothetical protein
MTMSITRDKFGARYKENLGRRRVWSLEDLCASIFEKEVIMIRKGLLIALILSTTALLVCKKSEKPEAMQKKLVFENLLSMNELSDLTGIMDIKMVPTDSLPDAKGELNFAVQDSTLILVVDYLTPDEFTAYKEEEGYLQAPVSGVGDEAYSAPAGPLQYILLFKKGDYPFILSSFLNPDSDWVEPFLNMKQLAEVANIIIVRLPTKE